VQNAEVLAAQTFDEFPAPVGDNHSDVHAVHSDADGGSLLLRTRLRPNTNTKTERTNGECCRSGETKQLHCGAKLFRAELFPAEHEVSRGMLAQRAKRQKPCPGWCFQKAAI